MKNILTCGIAIAALSLLAGGANAQTAPAAGTPTAKQDKRMGGMKRMVSELNLTPEQQEKVTALQKKASDQIKGFRTDAKLTPDQRQTKIKAVMKETGKAMEEVLTPEQKKKLKALREQARAAAKNKKAAKPGKA